jgi:HEAT repeat protein
MKRKTLPGAGLPLLLLLALALTAAVLRTRRLAPSALTTKNGPAAGGTRSAAARPPAPPIALAAAADDVPAAADDAALIGRFRDPAIPLARRIEEIRALGRSGTPEAERKLMRLGDAFIHVSRHAVEALGDFADEAARTYLAGRLCDPDADLAGAACRALGKSAGAEAVAPLAEALRLNRERPDGLQDTVCREIVKTLGLITEPASMAVLAAELERSEETWWTLDYGSEVVRALANCGGAAAREPLRAYAGRLEARLPDDLAQRVCIAEMIREARRAAGDADTSRVGQ